MRSSMHWFYLMIGISLLVGCETLNPPRAGLNPDFAPTYPVGPNPKQIRDASGSIYMAETALPLFETPRARHVGDIVTVMLMEKTDASKNQITRQRKNDNSKLITKTFFGRPISLGSGYSMDIDIDAKRQFDGGGQAVQNNKLAGSLSVTVSKVLSNGNMMIQGEKWIRINQGNEFVQISGIIRPQDLKPDNTITSDRVANARIAYGATGQVNNTNAQGWFSRFIWGPIFPM